MNNDTIASISTAPGESGIGIIRISGPESINIADGIYTDKKGNRSLTKYKSHTIHYGFISNHSGEVIDEVMISVMKKPNSYTCEDVIEINCHGGNRVCRNILETVVDAGARIADPGEFTKRAFLNGRIDLTRAEAVMDTIRASSDAALDQSVKQLQGNLYEFLNNICSEILYEIASIEAALDDPDSYDMSDFDDHLLKQINDISGKLVRLINSYDEGRVFSEGIRTSILGNPNAGKSSLLNRLTGTDRAIVTDIPGTTRDILTETILLDDIKIILTDTAGIRKTDDTIERIGVNKAIENASDADLILYVIDSTDVFDLSDEKICEILKNTNNIILLNKSDLKTPDAINEEKILNILSEKNIKTNAVIKTSVISGEGTEELKKTIRDLFYNGDINADHQVIITNLRHVSLLKKALSSLDKTKESVIAGVSEDLYCIDLTDAYRFLAEITGTEVSESIVEEIFSKFCMGK